MRSSPFPNNQQPSTSEILQPPRDAGEIRVGAIFDSLASSYHGLRSARAIRRMDRAGSVLEAMDHKESLYLHLGAVATNNDVALAIIESIYEHSVHENPKPRTWAERFMDKKNENKKRKKTLQESEREFVEKAYMGVRSNTMSLGSKLDGANRRVAINNSYKSGNITAAERTSEIAKIGASPLATENNQQSKSRKQLKGATKSLERWAKQPTLSRWRSAKKTRAIDTIIMQHKKAEEHKKKALSP